jgi:hypothetical protein
MAFLYEEELSAIKNTFSASGIEIEFRPASTSDIAYLREVGVPESVCHFYEQAEPSEGIESNDARLWPISELRVENEDAVPGYLIFPMGYRVIGTTIYGDIYCIDLNSVDSNGQPAVFLASHEEIYEGAKIEDMKSGIVKIAETFKEFLLKFAEGSLPTDFYDLKEGRHD